MGIQHKREGSQSGGLAQIGAGQKSPLPQGGEFFFLLVLEELATAGKAGMYGWRYIGIARPGWSAMGRE